MGDSRVEKKFRGLEEGAGEVLGLEIAGEKRILSGGWSIEDGEEEVLGAGITHGKLGGCVIEQRGLLHPTGESGAGLGMAGIDPLAVAATHEPQGMVGGRDLGEVGGELAVGEWGIGRLPGGEGIPQYLGGQTADRWCGALGEADGQGGVRQGLALIGLGAREDAEVLPRVRFAAGEGTG